MLKIHNKTKGGREVVIECHREVLDSHYERVCELAHLAIFGTPISPTEETSGPEPIPDKSREVANKLITAATSDNPERELKKLRDELRENPRAGGDVQLKNPGKPLAERLSEQYQAVRVAANKLAGLGGSTDPGINGFRLDAMAIAQGAKDAWEALDAVETALDGLSEAMVTAGFIVQDTSGSTLARSIARLTDSIGVGMRDRLRLKPPEARISNQVVKNDQGEVIAQARGSGVSRETAGGGSEPSKPKERT